jgi:heme exporter protein C
MVEHLHQGASVSLTAAPSMATVMLTGMLLVTLGAGPTPSPPP